MNDIEPLSPRDKLIGFFTETVINILKYEDIVGFARPYGISNKEIHVIEAIAKATSDGTPARASDIAASLRISPGTFTSSADVLEKKNYLTRTRDPNDQRSVRISLTDMGIQASKQHRDFHNKLVGKLLEEISAEDAQSLARAIDIIETFYKNNEETNRSGKVKIYADSTCDISPSDANRLGVTIVPMSTVFGSDKYRQNIDLSASEFFIKLANLKRHRLPLSSLLSTLSMHIKKRQKTEVKW